MIGVAQPSALVRLALKALLGIASFTLIAAPAAAQVMREIVELPINCTDVLPPEVRGTVQPWQIYVRLEHCDRMKSLRKLSTILPPDQRPRFYEGVVPASRLPNEFGVDMPVLRVVFPERTFFNTGRAALRPEAQQIAQIIADLLRNTAPDVAVFVAGHADLRGESAANELLSERRATAVAQQIRQSGVSTFRIWRIGFGEDMPLQGGTTDYDLAMNRRVEFLFASKPEAVGIWLADSQAEELCQSSNPDELDVCRQTLAFRPGYDAEVVNPTGPQLTGLEPVAAVSQTKVRPTGQRARRLGLGQAKAKSVDIAPQARAQVIPSNTRKIRIDPVNPDSKPVTVIL